MKIKLHDKRDRYRERENSVFASVLTSSVIHVLQYIFALQTKFVSFVLFIYPSVSSERESDTTLMNAKRRFLQEGLEAADEGWRR